MLAQCWRTSWRNYLRKCRILTQVGAITCGNVGFWSKFCAITCGNVGFWSKFCAITCGNVGILRKIGTSWRNVGEIVAQCWRNVGAITCGKCRNLAQVWRKIGAITCGNVGF